MRFLISKNILGTNKDIIIDRDTFTTTLNNGSEWSVDGCSTLKSLDVVSIINNRTVPEISSDVHRNAYSQLGVDKINWVYALGIENFKYFIDKVSEYAEKEIKFIEENEYYSNEFIEGRSVLFELEDYRIDDNVLNSHIKNADIRNLKLLNGFKIKEKIKYSQISSITGRLSISSGPNILHLKREHRDIFKSKYGQDGAIVQIDFKSLEPRILSLIMRDNVPFDLYTEASSIFSEKINRDIIKRATLAIIYGMSKSNLKNILRVNNSEEIYDHIVDYFGIKNLQKVLLNSIEDSGIIENFYGRKIYVSKENSHLFVNYFTQSTGVDVSLLGFRKIIDEIKNKNL